MILTNKKNVKNIFLEKYGIPELEVIVPGRANIIGEHTDYNLGYVLPFAINKKFWFYASKSDSKNNIFSINLNEYYDPEKAKIGSWHFFIKSILEYFKYISISLPNLNIVFGGNIPIGAGVSSSSALCCGMVEIIDILFKLKLKTIEKIKIASEIEHGSGVEGGLMDQTAIYMGKKDKAIFLDCKTNFIEYIKIPKSWNFVLINSNVNHNLVDTEYNDRKHNCNEVINSFNRTKIKSIRDISIPQLNQIRNKITIDSYQKVKYVIEENLRVLLIKKYIEKRDIENVGTILNQSHKGLKDMYKVSCKELDFIVAYNEKNKNVFGSRMMGGGFGGCVIALVKEKDDFENLKEKYYLKFQRDISLINIGPEKGLKHKIHSI